MSDIWRDACNSDIAPVTHITWSEPGVWCSAYLQWKAEDQPEFLAEEKGDVGHSNPLFPAENPYLPQRMKQSVPMP